MMDGRMSQGLRQREPQKQWSKILRLFGDLSLRVFQLKESKKENKKKFQRCSSPTV
jgi:hypothetical protein